MTEVVLRHPDLPNQPIIGQVAADGTVTPNLADAGWVIDLDTDPEHARRERPEPREQQPVTPHFAVAPTPDEAAPVAEQPAEPATPEQESTSPELDTQE